MRKYFLYDRDDDYGTTHLRSYVAYALDRYIHANKLYTLERDKLLPVYLPVETYLLDETLPVVVMVPILFLKFELQKFLIDESIWVEQLSDEQHLARGWRGPFGDSDNSFVESAATHGLFISNRSIENDNWLRALLTRADSYPAEEIDTFFAALRISTGYPTGQAQILTIPVGWASSYAADLVPIIEGPRTEKYPPVSRQGDWREKVPVISSSEADGIRETFGNLRKVFATGHAGKVHLAMSLLNLSSLRTTDEDGVIDAMIAMEALLSDGAQEMTHKVALRLAALYKILDPSRSEQVFKELKDVYRFRSKIVHGEASLDKHREIDRNGAKIPAVDVAVEHLRNAFTVLIKHPTLLDPKKIDAFLLTGDFQT